MISPFIKCAETPMEREIHGHSEIMIDTEHLLSVGHLNSFVAPSAYSPLVIIGTGRDRKGLTNIVVISHLYLFSTGI